MSLGCQCTNEMRKQTEKIDLFSTFDEYVDSSAPKNEKKKSRNRPQVGCKWKLQEKQKQVVTNHIVNQSRVHEGMNKRQQQKKTRGTWYGR